MVMRAIRNKVASLLAVNHTTSPLHRSRRFLRSEDIAPGVRHVVLECEIGRERVPLRNAYKAVGQRALVRVKSGVEYNLTGG